jgi:hypothetical protein
MPEQETVESWDSEEAEESEEAIGESEESEEAYSDRRRGRAPRPNRFRPSTGVGGITLRGPDGRPRNVQFPAKLATVADTNRGLASQDAARRALEDRLNKLETRHRGLMKTDGAVTGMVTLGLAGGLTLYGAFQSAQQASGSRLSDWANRESTHIAAVVSAGQLATTGAKFAIQGRYHGSRIGIAADIFAVLQLGFFAFASMNKPLGANRTADNYQDALKEVQQQGVPQGTVYVLQDDGSVFVVDTAGGTLVLRRVS